MAFEDRDNDWSLKRSEDNLYNIVDFLFQEIQQISSLWRTE